MRAVPVLFLFAVLAAIPVHAQRFAAWVPAWDSRALPVLQSHAGQLQQVNPVWYLLTEDATIEPVWNAENPDWIAAMTGVPIVPTIQNYGANGFDADRVVRIISDPAARAAHIDDLVYLVVRKAWSGIDLDYERLPLSSRDHFSLFVSELAAELHRHGKVLSVTVHPQTTGREDWRGPAGQDWVAIGKTADFVKIMAYDYHWSTSDAGAITPLPWLLEIAEHARQTLPLQKIEIGLPWFGYDWLGKSGKGVTWTDATTLANTHRATPQREENGELRFQYGDHVVYFQDAESFRIKRDAVLSALPDIGGFTAWRVGGEDPSTWDVVESDPTQPAPTETTKEKKTSRGRPSKR